MKRPIIHLLAILLFVSAGCKKTDETAPLKLTSETVMGILPVSFDWETVDWMPTPPGQSQIPPPWTGQGSIASTYGADVVNDHRKVDGWSLLYSTFDANAPGPLVNPYFILYNKYSGLMRIYLYTTTQFVTPSTYIVDGLSIVSNKSTTLLNFLGGTVSDPANPVTKVSKIEPAPLDGSQPLAANKWYMLQYEMAYDPNLTSLTSSDIQLSWFTNYNAVSQISLGGTLTGSVKTAVGAPGTALNDALQNGGKVAGQGVLALIGNAVLDNNGNATTGQNTMGLPNTIYKTMFEGIKNALSSSTSGIPTVITGIVNAVFGGGAGGQSINLTVNADINLNGTVSSGGSFPSSPTSFYVPGTNILSTAQNYIPLSNEPLGVFNFSERPVIDVVFYEDGYGASTQNIIHITYKVPTNPFIKNPAVFGPPPAGDASLQAYTDEPILLIPNGAFFPPYSLYATAQNEATPNGQIISSTQDLDDTYIGFDLYSTWMYEDFNHISWTDNDLFLYYLNNLALRVKFSVAAPNGYRTTIVKTFKANIRVTEYKKLLPAQTKLYIMK